MTAAVTVYWLSLQASASARRPLPLSPRPCAPTRSSAPTAAKPNVQAPAPAPDRRAAIPEPAAEPDCAGLGHAARWSSHLALFCDTHTRQPLLRSEDRLPAR